MAIRTLVLSPGQCGVLPLSAKVTGIVIDGDGQVTSTCGALPDPVSYVCYLFIWENDASGSLQDAYFVSLTVGDNIYNVPNFYQGYNNTNVSLNTLGAWITDDPQLIGVVKLQCEDHGSDHKIIIKIPAGLPAPILKVGNPYGSLVSYSFMEGDPNDSCDCS